MFFGNARRSATNEQDDGFKECIDELLAEFKRREMEELFTPDDSAPEAPVIFHPGIFAGVTSGLFGSGLVWLYGSGVLRA